MRDAIPAPARRRGGHPARRTFQALRIEVNDELAILAPSIDAAVDLLVPGGRAAVLAYHSGEDRIVKDRFREAATGGCTCPPELPCQCGAVAKVRLLRRGAWKPSAEEIEPPTLGRRAPAFAPSRGWPTPENESPGAGRHRVAPMSTRGPGAAADPPGAGAGTGRSPASAGCGSSAHRPAGDPFRRAE